MGGLRGTRGHSAQLRQKSHTWEIPEQFAQFRSPDLYGSPSCPDTVMGRLRLMIVGGASWRVVSGCLSGNP